MNKFWRVKRIIFIPVLLMLLLLSCRRPGDINPPFVLEETTKAERELLGKRLELALLTQADTYPLRSSAGFPNEGIFAFIQSLYDQANLLYKIDRQSPVEDRWAQNKFWRVRILESEVPQSFCLPGGAFFISEGMLRSLSNKVELYALMSYELTLMQEKYVLEELSEQFVSEDFANLIRIGTTKDGLNRQDLLDRFFEITFEDFQIFEADNSSTEHICNSSAYAGSALLETIRSIHEGSAEEWRKQKSYNGRVSNLNNQPLPTSCGVLTGDGSYQREVLDLL